MLQILFDWRNQHLHHFHIFGKDYGSNGADTRHVMLSAFGFQRGERFRYIYNFFAQWQCDIRLESTLQRKPGTPPIHGANGFSCRLPSRSS